MIWDKPSIQLVSTGDSDFAGPFTVLSIHHEGDSPQLGGQKNDASPDEI